MIVVGVLSVLMFLLGSLANSNDMSLSAPTTFHANWELSPLSPKYQQDEIIFEDFPKDMSVIYRENKNNLDVYEEQQEHDVYSFNGENYGKYFVKDTTYLIPNPAEREIQPSIRSVSNRFSIGSKNFVPICRTIRRTRRVRNDVRSEYRPETIDEYVCAHPYGDQDTSYNQHDNKVCGVAGFHCVQRYTNVHVTHKPYDSDAWHLETISIAYGCECMWPTQEHGDIERYHFNKENNTKYRCKPIGLEY